MVQSRQRQQRFRQPAHPLRRALASLKSLAILRRRTLTVQRHLRLRQHHRNRRPQFMRRVGRKLLLLRERRFQPRKCRVQHARKLPQFIVRIRRRDPLRKVPG